jgi:hypothetical protein
MEPGSPSAMRTILLSALLTLGLSANAETWLCIPEKAAFVSEKENVLSSGHGRSPDEKYLLTEKEGKWVVNIFGSKSERAWMECSSESFCESNEFGESIFVFFMRNENNVFTLGFPNWKEKERVFVTVIGRCSKIEV